MMQFCRDQSTAFTGSHASEVSQARFRVLNVSPFCLYLVAAWHFRWQSVHTVAAIGAAGYIGYAIAWFLIVSRASSPSATRRAVATVFDQALPALGVYLTGFLGGYIAWVSALGSIGSGLRFGTPYTWLSVGVGVPLMSTAFMLSPEWRTIPEVATGIILANMFIPLYAVLLFKRFEERSQNLAQQAAHFEAISKQDALTGVLNRTGFLASLAELQRHATEKAQKIAVLVLDLDGFKLINDSCGHAAGDAMLKAIATSLLAQLQHTEQIGRLGGDEFGILLPNVRSRTEVEDVATRLLSAIERVAAPKTHLGVSASIGAYLVSDHDVEAGERVMAIADGLMYEAKANGKGQWRIRDASAQ